MTVEVSNGDQFKVLITPLPKWVLPEDSIITQRMSFPYLDHTLSQHKINDIKILKHCIWNVYLSLCSGFGKVSTSVTASNIEGVITSLIAGVQPSLHYEGVGGTPVHGDIRNEQTIQVPRDPPASGTCIR